MLYNLNNPDILDNHLRQLRLIRIQMIETIQIVQILETFKKIYAKKNNLMNFETLSSLDKSNDV